MGSVVAVRMSRFLAVWLYPKRSMSAVDIWSMNSGVGSSCFLQHVQGRKSSHMSRRCRSSMISQPIARLGSSVFAATDEDVPILADRPAERLLYRKSAARFLRAIVETKLRYPSQVWPRKYQAPRTLCVPLLLFLVRRFIDVSPWLKSDASLDQPNKAIVTLHEKAESALISPPRYQKFVVLRWLCRKGTSVCITDNVCRLSLSSNRAGTSLSNV